MFTARFFKLEREIMVSTILSTCNILVTHLQVDRVEDNYIRGEIGTRQMYFSQEINEVFPSLEDTISNLSSKWGFSPHVKDWTVMESVVPNTLNLYIGRNENEDGYEISENDPRYREWKKGKFNLYTVTYLFNLCLIKKCKITPSTIREIEEIGVAVYY